MNPETVITYPTEPPPLETLLGSVPVRNLRNLKGQAIPDVEVRQLPLSALSSYLVAQGNEAVQCELLCKQPRGWGDTLSLESVEAILVEGDRINADFFRRWLSLRLARQERMEALKSQGSAATSPSPESGPSTG